MRGFIVGSFATGLLLVGLMELGGEAHADSRGPVTGFDRDAVSIQAFVAPYRDVEAERP
jgi:hypothetical protein